MTHLSINMEAFKDQCETVRVMLGSPDPIVQNVIRAEGVRGYYRATIDMDEVRVSEPTPEPVETGPTLYTYHELVSMLTSAANLAYHVDARPATEKQIAYLASLIANSDCRDPFCGNTNAVLTAKQASFMIDNYRR